jgi:hypothetical protein
MENVIAEDSALSSIQYEREMNENKSTSKIVVSDNVFCNLIDNLEEFGKHMEKVCKKFEEKIVSQSQLIESLSARIEYLEIDSKTKDRDIKRLRDSILVNQTQVTTNENVKSSEISQNDYGTIMECKICKKKFKNYTSFKNHSHYKCMACDMVFASKKKRRKHNRKIHKKLASCTLCSHKCRDEIGLRQHFRAKHLNNTSISPQTSEFIHEIIPRQFPSKKKPHYQLKCKICKEIFNDHLLFNKHAKSLHGYRFSCPTCSKVFPEKRLYKEHTKKVYTCQFCNKKVIGEGGLISHCKAKNHQLNMEEFILKGIQISTLPKQIFTQEESKLGELEIVENNGSFDDIEDENKGHDYTEESDNDYTEEENEGSDNDDYAEESDTEEESEESDFTEEENEESDFTEEENEKSDNDDDHIEGSSLLGASLK